MDQSALSSRAISGMYFAALEQNAGAAWVNGIANLFDSDQSLETYPFLGQVPRYREWLGGRSAKGLRSDAFSILNKHYEATLELSLKDIRRDKTGQIEARMREFVSAQNSHWASLLSTLTLNGATTVCYDGQYFFDTDHSTADSGTQSNSIQVDISALPTQTHGVITLPSIEEMQLSILQAITQIQGLKDDRGEPLNEDASGFVVMVPTSLGFVAKMAVAPLVTANNAVANMNPNIVPDLSVSVAVNARLNTWTSKFAVFRTDSAIKAFIRQRETDDALKVKGEDSEYAFDNDAIQIGLDAWRNAGYGLWQRACQVEMI